jgi:hypothetical protein
MNVLAGDEKRPSLLTVKLLAQKYPWLTEAGLRHFLFYKNKNGLNKAVRKMGRRVLIDETAFFEWIESQGNRLKGGKK